MIFPAADFLLGAIKVFNVGKPLLIVLALRVSNRDR